MSDFPYIRANGSAFERGREYGEQAVAMIHRSTAIYFPSFASRGIEWSEVSRMATGFLRDLEQYDEEATEEVRGIAKGAGVSVETIVALNARTEILYSAKTGEQPTPAANEDGCTTAGCGPTATSTGHTLLGQNWDWKPETRDTTLILHMIPDDGPAYITVVEAGMLARSGANSAGVGVAGNFISSASDTDRSGIPIPFIRHKLLRSTTLGDALKCVYEAPRAFSSNYLVGAAGGSVIDLEGSPNEVFPVRPNSAEVVTHSNHFKSLAAQVKLRDTGLSLYPDSLYRDQVLERRLSAVAPYIEVKTIQDAMSDHSGYPHSVCRHLPEKPGSSDILTAATIVMDLDDRMLWISRGPVCENDYKEYRIDAS
jgi:isopenicillin-N N-acyltransferase-like protein